MPKKLTETLNMSNKEITDFILELLCKDFTQCEIAEMMEVSQSTIEVRVKNIKEQYNAKTMHGLIFKYLNKKMSNNKNTDNSVRDFNCVNENSK